MKSPVAPFFFALVFIHHHHTLDAFPDDDVQMKHAVRKWIVSTFHDIYVSQLLPHPQDVREGEEVYKTLVVPDVRQHQISIVSGADDDDLDGDVVKKMVDSWTKNGVITKSQGDELKEVVEDGCPRSKIVRTTLHQSPTFWSNEVIFGVVGIARDSSSRFTMVSSFLTDHFKKEVPNIEVSSSSSEEGCQLWGIYCPRTYSIPGVKASSTRTLFEFLRDRAIRILASTNNSTHLQEARGNAQKVQESLPRETMERVKQLYDPSNEGKAWDTILAEDPLQWDKIPSPQEEEAYQYDD